MASVLIVCDAIVAGIHHYFGEDLQILYLGGQVGGARVVNQLDPLEQFFSLGIAGVQYRQIAYGLLE